MNQKCAFSIKKDYCTIFMTFQKKWIEVNFNQRQTELTFLRTVRGLEMKNGKRKNGRKKRTYLQAMG